ncbi:nucleotidyltransferase domain-containing protein [candidate division KSB1 bacterium]|nr:nucleotidyltransferase domain-containing protein [candidate division KSB1 bacterium]
MKFGLKSADLKLLTTIIRAFPEVDQAIIFGSRAMGNYKNGSDVDIALKGETISHEIVTQINYQLNEELPLPYFFDVVHFESIENQDLINHINQYGQIFFNRESL